MNSETRKNIDGENVLRRMESTDKWMTRAFIAVVGAAILAVIAQLIALVLAR